MKRHIVPAISFWLLLTIFYSCQYEENIFPDQQPTAGTNVHKVTFDGITVRDTVIFRYQKGKIESVNWCTSLISDPGCVAGYSETRLYNSIGKLDSVGGKWNVSYRYENGLRKSIVAFLNGAHYSTTTFLQYEGIYPKTIKVEFATSDALYVDLTFNSSGDVIRKTIKKDNNILLEDATVTYMNIDNPLYGIMETPSYAALFFGFDDFIFYHTRHFPQTVTTLYTADNPVAPKRSVINYQTTLNVSGHVISAAAFNVTEGQQINAHNIVFAYNYNK